MSDNKSPKTPRGRTFSVDGRMIQKNSYHYKFSLFGNDISSRIQTIAKVLFFILAISAIIAGIICLVAYAKAPENMEEMATDSLWWGLSLLIVGPIESYVISLAYYGLGTIISNQKKQNMYLSSIEKKLEHLETIVREKTEK